MGIQRCICATFIHMISKTLAIRYHLVHQGSSGDRRASIHRSTKGKSTIAGASSAPSPLCLWSEMKDICGIPGELLVVLPSLGKTEAGAGRLVSAVPLMGGHRGAIRVWTPSASERAETPRMNGTKKERERKAQGRRSGDTSLKHINVQPAAHCKNV